jgi:hypothetical protein
MARKKNQKIIQRYSALLVFQFRVEYDGASPWKRRLCEKRMILIEAPNAKAALRAAKRLGKQAQHSYENSDGGTVHFEFIGMLDLLHLGIECEENEVWYNMFEMVEPMERKDRLPKEFELRAIVDEEKSRATKH